MGTVESYLFGNGTLHDRFCATAEILARFVSDAPHAVGMGRLEMTTDRSAAEIIELCADLERAGLVQPVGEAADQWMLACDASIVTLEDVFRCVFDDRLNNSSSCSTALPGRAQSDVELLLMQAMLTINQSIHKDLRQFSFDRLKARTAGMFPASHRRFSNASLDNDFRLPALDCDTTMKQVDMPVFLEQ